MKKIKVLIASAALAVISIPATANVGGESEDDKLMTTTSMELEVFKRVQDVDGENYNLKDATVTVSFFINPTGDVAVEKVEGESGLANLSVARNLMKNKMYVTPELQNTRHTVKLRYILP